MVSFAITVTVIVAAARAGISDLPLPSFASQPAPLAHGVPAAVPKQSPTCSACYLQPPHCDPVANECGSWVVFPYFLSFVVLVSMVMLNLFTAVIIEAFEAQEEQDVRMPLRTHLGRCAAQLVP
jgi:hypothetical protein